MEPNGTPPASATSSGGRLGLLRPLRSSRDFTLLWVGMSVSLLGDGFFWIALAWEVYRLSGAPAALSLVGFCYFTPQVVFLLLGGALSDRLDRRRMMWASNLLSGASVGALGLLVAQGHAALWQISALVAIYALSTTMFNPAFTAIVPDIVPTHLLVEANSLDQFVRPFALQLAGPALGGLVVGAWGPGTAFQLDAASFFFAGVCIFLMKAVPRSHDPAELGHSTLRQVAEGLRFVRSQPWLWACLVAVAISLLLMEGPDFVLVPLVVKVRLHGSAAALGLVYAAGGLGAILVSLLMAQRGMPRRMVTVMYLTMAIGMLTLVVFGVATALWQVLVADFICFGLFAATMIIWQTLMQTLVPSQLLGRVSSVDWMVSLGLAPISMILVGPVAALVGVGNTLVGAGLGAALVVMLFLFIPGARDPERGEAMGTRAPAPG